MKVKTIDEHLFRAVCIFFSAVMIVFSLLASIKLAAVNDEAARLEKEAEELETENEILTARYESSVTLQEIEDYAVNKLGMQRLTPGQIYYIELPEGELPEK